MQKRMEALYLKIILSLVSIVLALVAFIGVRLIHRFDRLQFNVFDRINNHEKRISRIEGKG